MSTKQSTSMSTVMDLICSAKPNKADRDYRVRGYGRQGDVYITKIGGFSGKSPWRHERRTDPEQVAIGMTKGARHIAVGDVRLMEISLEELSKTIAFDPPITSVMVGPVVVATEDWELVHPEHAKHIYSHGCFAVIYQAASPEMLNRQED